MRTYNYELRIDGEPHFSFKVAARNLQGASLEARNIRNVWKSQSIYRGRLVYVELFLISTTEIPEGAK